MKKIILLFIIICLCSFVGCIEKNVEQEHIHEFVDGVCSCGDTKDVFYNVTFVDFDGNILKEMEVKKNESAIAPSSPSRDGYEFIGWSTDFSTIVSDTIIVAQYQDVKDKIKVVFIDYNGDVLKQLFINENDYFEAPIVPYRKGYEFIGWDKEFNNVTEDIIITALYKEVPLKTFTVTFKDYDGTILKVEEVVQFESAKAPNNPERNFYEFIGWSREFNYIEEDIEVIAQYKMILEYFRDLEEVDFKIKSDQKVYLTTLGQSDFDVVASIIDKTSRKNVIKNNLLNASDVEEGSIVFLVTGTSTKGLGSAGTYLANEIVRAEDFAKAANENKITLIVLHVGGEQRRGAQADPIINIIVPASKLVMIVETGNKDALFTNLTLEFDILLYQYTRSSKMQTPIDNMFE